MPSIEDITGCPACNGNAHLAVPVDNDTATCPLTGSGLVRTNGEWEVS